MADQESPIYKRPWFIAIIAIIILVLVYYCAYCRVPSKKSKKTTKKTDNSDKTLDEPTPEKEPESENFIASGGRDDPHGGDWALKDKIHDINERQRRYVQNAKYSYRYDPREDSAAPVVYSPEAELQGSLYP